MGDFSRPYLVGWRITEEAFMKNQKIFDDLKLRVGYGVTGSQPKDPFLGVAMLKYGSYAFCKWKLDTDHRSGIQPES